MADGLGRLSQLSASLLFLLLTSVVADAENSATSRDTSLKTMCVISRLKDALRAALRTGKIRQLTPTLGNVNNMATGRRGMFNLNSDRFDVFDVDSWTPFLRQCSESEWQCFERAERAFRKRIASSPMNVKQVFYHPNPGKWRALLTMLTNIFYRDDHFLTRKPNGTPYSFPFLKFILRVLFSFPICMPEMFPLNGMCLDSVLNTIEFLLTDIPDRIFTCITKHDRPHADRDTPTTASDEMDDSIISREELTRMWKESQSKAIDTIENDCRVPKRQNCALNMHEIEHQFTEKCARKLDNLPSEVPWKEIHTPSPKWTPSTDEFTEEEVLAVINSLPRRKSPGADGVTYETVKTHKKKLAPIFTAIANACLANKRVPSDWKHGITTLIPKKDNPSAVDDWRPISLLLTSYKLFMKLLVNRHMPWIVDTERLSKRQKGAMPRNGLQESVFCLRTSIADFLHSSSTLYVAFFDIKDAFGSIDHQVMIKELVDAGYPQVFVDITKDLYKNSTFQVKARGGITRPIRRGKGIIQGCPWSVIIFQQGIDKWLRWIEHPYQETSLPNPIQGYVDDVVAVGTTEQQIKEAVRKTEEFMETSGMEVKHQKCAVLHGRRSGNNWYKNDKTGNIELHIQNSPLPMYSKDQPYTYLGFSINLSNTASTIQATRVANDFKVTLRKIDAAPLPVTAKLQAINTMCSSRLNFYFSNLTFTEKCLDELEDEIVRHVRRWLQLNNSSNRDFMFCPRAEGGLGLMNPHTLYRAKHVSFMLSMLNSDDGQVRETARTSLRLHMEKRKVPLASRDDENTFAGFRTSTKGKIEKNSRVNWAKSDWIHLNEICTREKVLLKKELGDEEFSLNIKMDEHVSIRTTDSSSAYTILKRKKLSERADAWREKHSQGRIAREATAADHKLSMAFLSNMKLRDNVVSFIIRGRLQLLQCNSLLATYYPLQYSKSCALCKHPSDTASHILNGCTKFQKLYQARHNRIVDLICQHVPCTATREVIKDSVLSPELFHGSNTSFQTSSTRPDITIIDEENRDVLLTEIAVPFDSHIDQCYEQKFLKYLNLCQEISSLGYRCRVIVVVIGSLGTVHRRVVPGLHMMGVPRYSSKWLARYLSTSAALGSFIAWQRRCSDMKFTSGREAETPTGM